ncbi:MAG: nucleotide sugar dehydrogenase [Candidatus Omnitrophota bacterium]|nr:nucleotide sugar dehydrogenase [Candidatus Omnitrophota bacterium]
MDTRFSNFLKRINSKVVKIAVVGLGYVGLPLALEFAKKGIKVQGVDIDTGRLRNIRNKKSYITDVSDKELRHVLARGKLSASSDFSKIKEVDVVFICVPTPLRRKYLPDVSYIKQAVIAIAKNINPFSAPLIILESTTYPGTTEEVILPILEKDGLKHNQDFYLCFSPERIDPGNKLYPLNKIPKIIGGITQEAGILAASVYRIIVDKVVPVSTARTAETAKLLENTFRLVNIGLIDELAQMAHKMKINIWEVIEAAKTKPFGFMPFYPGPGCGGHCIPKDPLYLYWEARHHEFKPRFIKLASDITNRMPEYVVCRLEQALAERNAKLERAKILVVGVTYKKDIKDLRKSPSLDIIDILKKRNVKASYFDPLIPYLKIGRINLKSIDLTIPNLNKFHCVIIAVDHSSIDYNFILKNSKLIFDTHNIYKGKKDKRIILL